MIILLQYIKIIYEMINLGIVQTKCWGSRGDYNIPRWFSYKDKILCSFYLFVMYTMSVKFIIENMKYNCKFNTVHG